MYTGYIDDKNENGVPDDDETEGDTFEVYGLQEKMTFGE